MVPVPPIFSPRFGPGRCSLSGRLLGLLLAAGCAWLLITAARVAPNRSGVGTHAALGYAECGFLAVSGIPCLTCGMTTSFAFFVRGQVAASIYVQPMGAILAVLACLGLITGLYIAATGRAVQNLLRYLPMTRVMFILLGLALLAWAWKIVIHMRGLDGW